MHDFPGNSRRTQQGSDEPPGEPKRREQITSTEAKVRKRGLGQKVKETFIGGTARGAAEYVVTDVFVPTIREMLFEAFHEGMQKLIFGDSRIQRGGRPPGYPGQNQGPQVNYSAISTGKPTTSRSLSQRSRARHDFGEIVIVNRQEAEEVLEILYDELSRYGRVSVAVLYELTGIQSSHVDHKWGWTSLRGARIVTMRGRGYLLDLPAPEPIDQR